MTARKIYLWTLFCFYWLNPILALESASFSTWSWSKACKRAMRASSTHSSSTVASVGWAYMLETKSVSQLCSEKAQARRTNNNRYTVSGACAPLFYRNRDKHEERISGGEERNSISPAAPATAAMNNLEKPTTTLTNALLNTKTPPIHGDKDTVNDAHEGSSVTMVLPGLNKKMIVAYCLLQILFLGFGTMVFSFAIKDGINIQERLNWAAVTTSETTATSTTAGAFSSLIPIAMGVLAAVPMIAVANAMIHSADHNVSLVNFSNNNLVVSLFGRRRQKFQRQHYGPKQQHRKGGTTPSKSVMLTSIGIATVIALSQELVFRAYLPTLLKQWMTSPEPFLLESWEVMAGALLGQAILFGLGHIQPSHRPTENLLAVLLQALNGMWYGSLYLMTGGNLVPCMIAHMLYAAHVFGETWHRVNNQMDWTELMLSSLNNDLVTVQSTHDHQLLQALREQGGQNLSEHTWSMLYRFFYAFDSHHQQSLSLLDVHRAVSYAFLTSETIPSKEQVEQVFYCMLEKQNDDQVRSDIITEPRLSQSPVTSTDQLRLPGFLRLLFLLRQEQLVSKKRR